MFKNSKILALIPARGGSKGIKGKNIIPLGGKPLISYSIQSALESKYVDDVVVSTDSKEIAEIAQKYGAQIPFMRPSELAGDSIKTIDVVIHAIQQMKSKGCCYDTLLLLQPTQPLRTAGDIDGAIRLFYEKGCCGLASVSPVDDHPILIRSLSDNGILTPLLDRNSTCRRQDMPVFYKINGCVYLNSIDEINVNTSFNDNPIGYVMKRTHSVDIDERKDLCVAEYYIKQFEEEEKLL